MENKTISIQDATKAFAEYIHILNQERYGHPTEADVQHSALLQRLLSGKKPLPLPPPLAMSYPNYSLVENGRDTPFEVSSVKDSRGVQYVAINQSRWNLVKELPKENEMPVYIVTWKDQPQQYIVKWALLSREVSTCEGTPGIWRKEKRNGWLMERYDE